MNITLKELHSIKYALPYGSISLIANQLGIEEQAVYNYFKLNTDMPTTASINQNETINIEDTEILAMALLICFRSQRDGSIALPENSLVEEQIAIEYPKVQKQTIGAAIQYVLNKNEELYKRLA
jgi:hypothetical protein